MFVASEYWITVAELPTYEDDIKQYLTAEEADGLIAQLAQEPDVGRIVPGTCGLRKLSWGGRGRGAGAGAQVFYFFRDLNMPLYLIAAFPRGVRIRLKETEKALMREVVTAIVASYWSKQISPMVDRTLKPAG